MSATLNFELNKTMLWAGGSFVAVSQIALASFMISVGIFGQGICADTTTNLVVSYGISLISIATLFSGFWHLYKVTHTNISETGLSQPSLRGRTQITWNNVDRVKLREGNVLDIHGSCGRIAVATAIYRNPERVLTVLLGKLAEHGKV